MDSQVQTGAILPALERLAPPTIDDLVRTTGGSLQKLDEPCSDEDLITISSGLTEWRTVAPHLGLKEGAIEEIERDKRTEGEKRLKALRKWKNKYGSIAKYRVLIEALLKCDMADLAEKVCRLPVADAQERRDDSTTDRGNALEAPTTTIQNIFSEIRELEMKYAKLVDEVEDSLTTAGTNLSQLKNRVIRLPVSMKYSHWKLLEPEAAEAIDNTRTIRGLITLLHNHHWDFLNCELLCHIVDSFGDPTTKESKRNYLNKLGVFRAKTKLKDLIQWSGTRSDAISLPAEKELVLQMGEEWGERTLEELEQFRIEFSRQCFIQSYAIKFRKGEPGSIAVTFALPKSVDIAALCLQDLQEFLKQHHVLRIMADGHCIFDTSIPKVLSESGLAPRKRTRSQTIGGESELEDLKRPRPEANIEREKLDVVKQKPEEYERNFPHSMPPEYILHKQYHLHERSDFRSSLSPDAGFSETTTPSTSGYSSRRTSVSEVVEIQSHHDKQVDTFAEKLHTDTTVHNVAFIESTISDKAAGKLGDALRNNKSLRELKLDHCEISPNGISSLATALRTNTSLRTLRFHDCGLSDKATEHLAEALKKNTTLLELDLGKASCRNKITSQGASALAEMLRINKTLKDLSLFGNDISDIGVRKLAEALQNNKSLEKLDLSTTKVTADGASALAETLRKNNSLKKLYLWGNKLSDSGMSSLAKALKKNKSLEELDLCFNMISDEGVRELSAALRANKSLKFLWFSFDIVTDAGADELVRAIDANQSLRRLELVRTSDISKDLQKRLKETAEKKGLELTLL